MKTKVPSLTLAAVGIPLLFLLLGGCATQPSAENPAQQAYVKASNTGPGDMFGSAVSIWGDTMVVGARHEASKATGVNGDQSDNSAKNSGAAYVFVRSGTNWTQQAYLKASNTGTNDSSWGDSFGWSVAVSGDTVVVGARGESSSATGVNGNQRNNSATNSGAAYVFVRSGTSWTQQAYLKASNTEASDCFGFSVAVSSNAIVVGSPFRKGAAGAAYVFVRSGINWTQQAYLEASNTRGQAFFGWSVAVSGDTVVIGSNEEGGRSGAAYAFVRSGTNWSQQAYLKASNTEADDHFGGSVAVSGDTVVVGARWESSNATGVNGDQSDNSAKRSGAAYVFARNGTNWSQQAYLKASNTGGVIPPSIFGDSFGSSVAVSINTVVVGAHSEFSNATGVNGNQGDNSATNSGAAYVFVRNGTNWSQRAYLKASNTDAWDCFGWSVAVSGDTVVVGTGGNFGGEDSNATGVNGNQNDNSATNSGAAYVFTGLGLAPKGRDPARR